jgi:hypothetical protein
MLGQQQRGVRGEVAMFGTARAFDHDVLHRDGRGGGVGQYVLFPQARNGLQDELVQGVFHAGGFRKSRSIVDGAARAPKTLAHAFTIAASKTA